tara:strand:+ start:4083 stop:4802 length:720 start_codon:yes stop_codon:yes gene_type:complete
MRAIILAAGRGSRLKNLTKKEPKCFIKINTKPLIQHQIDALKKNNINNISAVVGYKKEKFKDLNIKRFYNKEWSNTNMVYSLFKAKNWLFRYDCLISYSDILFDEKIIIEIKKKKQNLSLPFNKNWKKNWILRYKNPLTDLETFKIKKKILIEIGNTPKSYSEIDGQFMGLIKLSSSSSKKMYKIFNSLPNQLKKKIQFTKFLNTCIKKYNLKVYTYPIKNYWFELDNKRDLQVIKKNF